MRYRRSHPEGPSIDSKVVEALVAAKSRTEESALAELTPRERQILEEMAAD